MTTRFVYTPRHLARLFRLLARRERPFTVTVVKGAKRSTRQNRLNRLWMKEIAGQVEDTTAEEVRGFCKLAFGVPILRAENEAFRESYDRVFGKLAYEERLTAMQEPLDLPVTRLMNVGQERRYLDEVQRFWLQRGIALTDPDPMMGGGFDNDNRARSNRRVSGA